ncbi:MAG: type I-E CRISPR-associated protein Cas6/Cse3/CasE [Polyangiaceae bacterium]|nr:type I-E CRISPR-associated protein Cas6/Cse3/CasE [Polyangiaceae bacterium]
MYLARAFLNPISRAVRADLADVMGLHRTLMRAFPDDAGLTPRKQHGVLYRVDEDVRRGRVVLLVQSATRPDFARLPAGYILDLGDDFDSEAGVPENPAVRAVDEERGRIAVHDRFAFRLRANTTKRIPKLDRETNSKTKNGQRVPVRGDDGRLAWLARHAQKAGFVPEAVRLTEVPPRAGGGRRELTFAGAIFEGRLRVTDADAFRAALAEGIGPAKAFGFGLLSIQRVR